MSVPTGKDFNHSWVSLLVTIPISNFLTIFKLFHIISRGDFMENSNCSGCDFVGLAASVAIFISKQIDSDKLDILASFFSALGDNLGIISASK